MGDAAAEAENTDAKFVHFCWVPRHRWDGPFEGISHAHSRPPSLAGENERADPILQSCKIGTTSRVEKASEQTLVGLNMAWKEKEREGEGKEEEMAGLGA